MNRIGTVRPFAAVPKGRALELLPRSRRARRHRRIYQFKPCGECRTLRPTMGIDIYAVWKGQTEAEKTAQYGCAFSSVGGHTGYLREAYHGVPYATKFLCREAFESATCRAPISAEVLHARLPETLRLAEERERQVYEETDEHEIELVRQSFRDFVALCEAKEQETGEPVAIVASY